MREPDPEVQAIERVWRYYLEVIPSKRRLDYKRRRLIRDAVQLVGEEATKLAILGLSRSPHHNGANEQKRSYLELRYALKGLGDESDDERIEKAIGWAAAHAPGSSVDPDKVDRWLDDVRYYLGKLAANPDATAGRERAVEAYRFLAVAGFKVIRLDRPPWARVSR